MIPGAQTPNDYNAWIENEARQQTDEIRQDMEARFGEAPTVYLKNNSIEDLQKARWYIDREIQRKTAHPQQ